MDAQSGILSGTTPREKGQYPVTLTAKNRAGEDSAVWTLVVGDTLALTPPMGWNHWYTHYHFITDKKIRAAAAAMVRHAEQEHGRRRKGFARFVRAR